MSYTKIKLIVTDHGDPSVGIFEQSYEVEVPFCREDSDEHMLEGFRHDVIMLYDSYSDGRTRAEYDFERNYKDTDDGMDNTN